jgi:hypothetical protein
MLVGVFTKAIIVLSLVPMGNNVGVKLTYLLDTSNNKLPPLEEEVKVGLLNNVP